eukprot:3875235-Prorocentrum_lima.AAC.1
MDAARMLYAQIGVQIPAEALLSALEQGSSAAAVPEAAPVTMEQGSSAAAAMPGYDLIAVPEAAP